MSALEQDRQTPRRKAVFRAFPVAEGVICRQGGIGVINGDGYVEPGTEGEGLVTAGRFEQTVDNSTGENGDKYVTCRGGTDAYAYDDAADVSAITTADIGKLAYIVDDQTVSKTATGRSPAGQIFDVTDEGVHIVFAPLPTTIGVLGATVSELVTVLALSGAVVHYDADTDLVAETAVDGEAEIVTRANALKVAYEAHRADTDLHSSADSTNAVSAANATNLATAQTLLNELKADINAHLAVATIHRRASVAPFLVSAADASDEATAEALALDISKKLNLHTTSGLAL